MQRAEDVGDGLRLVWQRFVKFGQPGQRVGCGKDAACVHRIQIVIGVVGGLLIDRPVAILLVHFVPDRVGHGGAFRVGCGAS